ncbi:MAG TPA: hypothetical protein PLF26_04750, partial [Blastocatellia bacterium]|nr:hypothetical protein [Blastocatellia bacterium]
TRVLDSRWTATVVKQDGTNASVRVHIPEGGSLQLSPISQHFAGRTSVGIEQATLGQQVNAQVSGDVEPSMSR